MGFSDSLINFGKGAMGGAATGAGIGSFFPGYGTAIGGVAGGLIGGLTGLFGSGDNDAAEEQARKQAALWDALQYQDPNNNPMYADSMRRLQEYGKGGLTAEDKARELEALGQAQQFTQGQRGAIDNQALARGGGVANAGTGALEQQVAVQGAAGRLNQADVATMGMASQRAFAANQELQRQLAMNSQMQNEFAMRKAGGQAGGAENLQRFYSDTHSAQQANLGSFTNQLGGMGMAMLGRPGGPLDPKGGGNGAALGALGGIAGGTAPPQMHAGAISGQMEGAPSMEGGVFAPFGSTRTRGAQDDFADALGVTPGGAPSSEVSMAGYTPFYPDGVLRKR